MDELLDLRALQLNVEYNQSVEYVREVLTEAVEFFSSKEISKEAVKQILLQYRDGFDVTKLKETGIFFWDDSVCPMNEIPDEYKAYNIGLFSSEYTYRFFGRLVYPVRDVLGKVMGLCGWYPESDIKYLDSVTYGYNAKRNCMYGMEELSSYYEDTKQVFIVEGIPCCNYLRSQGFNALALLGSTVSTYVSVILNRLGNRCIFLCDADTAGAKTTNYVKRKIKLARCYMSTIAKDIDDSRRVDEASLLRDLNKLSSPLVSTEVLQIVG